MHDSIFRWTAVEGRYSLNGASYVISVNLGWESIRSAIIYDDELAVTFTDLLGHLQWLVMPLVRTYDDVGNIQLRAQDDSSDTGWRYVPFEFARGVPDLTPVKVKGSKGNDTLYGGFGDDTLSGNGGDDVLYGGTGDDSLNGGSGDDNLNGSSGDDALYGGEGHDTLIGGKGADLIDGESGNDVLIGGAGNDVFIFFRPTDRFKINEDTITDFELGSDKIRIADDMLSALELSVDVDDDTDALLSLTLSYELEPDWFALWQAFQAGRYIDSSTVNRKSSELTLEFSGLSTDEFFATADAAGEINSLLFDVV